MFLGYNFLSDDSSLLKTTTSEDIIEITISNGIYDHMNFLSDIETFSTTIPSWESNTILNCNFNDNLFAGNVSEIITNLQKIVVRKKEINDTEWLNLIEIDISLPNSNVYFTMIDTYNKNNTLYEYQILPINNDGIIGSVQSNEIYSCFNHSYICDAYNSYMVKNELEYSNFDNSLESGIYKPFGSKYPVVVNNSDISFEKGTLTALLLSSSTRYSIDRINEIKLRKEFNVFLSNKRAKILKDLNGNLWVIMITSPISNNFYKELGNGIASTTFDWVEIGNLTNTYLDKLGMTYQFPLTYIDGTTNGYSTNLSIISE
jgi:hypothetical protein